jgi:hypothetical protein
VIGHSAILSERKRCTKILEEFDLLSLLLHILSTGSATFQGPSCLEAHSGATDAKAVLSV